MRAAKYQSPDMTAGEHLLVVGAPSCCWRHSHCRPDHHARWIAGADIVLETRQGRGDRLRDPGWPVLGKPMDGTKVLAAPQGRIGGHCRQSEDEVTSITTSDD